MNADIRVLSSQPKEAETDLNFEKAVFSGPQGIIARGAALCELALERIGEKRFAKDVIAAVKPLLEQDQDNIRARLMLAKAFDDLGKPDKAVKEWEAVMVQASSTPVYREELKRSVDALYQLQRKDLAFQGLETLVKWEPGNVQYLERMGAIAFSLERREVAENCFERVLKLIPEE